MTSIYQNGQRYIVQSVNGRCSYVLDEDYSKYLELKDKCEKLEKNYQLMSDKLDKIEKRMNPPSAACYAYVKEPEKPIESKLKSESDYELPFDWFD